jgi:hypothetical protein
MKGSVRRWAALGLATSAMVIACALCASSATAAARCHGHFPNFLGYSYYRLDVTVYYHRRMNCAQAVKLARQAYSLPRLQVIRDPFVFGGGGFGGPFWVGHFGCFLTARGSDFQQAYCASGNRAIFYFDHRESV